MGVNLGTAVGYLDLDTSKFTMGFKNALSSVEKFKKGTGGVSGMLKGVSNGLSSAGKDITLKVSKLDNIKLNNLIKVIEEYLDE